LLLKVYAEVKLTQSLIFNYLVNGKDWSLKNLGVSDRDGKHSGQDDGKKAK
jgi:hypothetical protein